MVLMKVLKFGGSSLASADRIRRVGEIAIDAAKRGAAIVVVSALGGVTNELLDCARLAEHGDRRWEPVWKKIAARHRAMIDSLLGKRSGVAAHKRVASMLDDLHDT